MEPTSIRRTRRCLWVAALGVAVWTVGMSTAPLSAQTPTQPTPPAAKGRTRVRSGQPAGQPPKTDEAKSVPEGAAETPPEGIAAQPQLQPPQPAAPRPTRPAPSKEGESNEPVVRPVTPEGTDGVEAPREPGVQPPMQPPTQPPTQGTTTNPKESPKETPAETPTQPPTTPPVTPPTVPPTVPPTNPPATPGAEIPMVLVFALVGVVAAVAVGSIVLVRARRK
jgi:hypothetical protein